MKILVTGSTGFVGHNLKEYFQARYENVLCPVRKDLNLLDYCAVRAYLAENRFDAVLHCGVTLASVEENLKMYFNIESCSASFGRLICVGSGAEYDVRCYSPVMAESRFGQSVPADIYGFSKYVMAKDIEARARNIYNLRVFGIYGKYENYRRRFISNNICRVLSGLTISIKRNVVFDYIYVDDFARIVDVFLHASPAARSYNICTGLGVDLLSLAKIIQAVDGRNVPIEVKENGLGTEYTGDNSLFSREFGPFEFTAHEKAIRELYRWYRDESNIRFDAKDFE